MVIIISRKDVKLYFIQVYCIHQQAIGSARKYTDFRFYVAKNVCAEVEGVHNPKDLLRDCSYVKAGGMCKSRRKV